MAKDMNVKKYIGWRRVSTFKQNRSGLGLEAQKEIIRYFVERDNGELVADYSECYTGTELSGCKELRKAMQHAKNIGAVLVIAKSDRFRNCQEALGILDEMGEGHIEFCDLPHSDRFTLTLFWALAEREALITSIRTKQALAAKRARGEKLGGACDAWQESYKNKNENEIKKTAMARGNMKRIRHQQSRDMVAFKMVLKKVFPRYTKSDNPGDWQWAFITTKETYRKQILSLMEDYKALDDNLFRNWDFNNAKGFEVQKLRNYLSNFKRSYTN